MYTDKELKHCFDLTEPSVIFCDEVHYDKLRNAGISEKQLFTISPTTAQGRRSAESISADERTARKAKPTKVKDLDQAA